jgi:predicted dehydrogenase
MGTFKKAAVIGVFNIGKQHVRAWSNTEGVKLVAIADLNPEQRDQVQNEFAIEEAYGDYTELLKHSDAEIISVCLPTSLHERVVTDCLRSGRHVLCEKPPATTAREAARMHECAVKIGKQLGYSLQRRFSGQVQAVRRAVANGEVGEVFYGKTRWTRRAPISIRDSIWRFDSGSGGGSLLDLGVHLLDAAWYSMGCPQPLSARGFTSSAQVADFCRRRGLPMPDKAADDTAAAWLTFANGASLVMESSYGMWTVQEDEVYSELHGTEGAVRIYPGPALLVNGEGRRELSFPLQDEGHLGITQDFIQAVETGRPPCIDGMQGILLHQMLDAIVLSSEQGREIRIGIDG